MPEYFVIAGAQRCGTTYLYRLLDEHPEIEMAKPMRPEPKFFLDDAHYPLGLAYYESHFFSEAGARARGEKSTSYIESEIAAERINDMLPGATVVVVLRDPVRRAISNYRFSAQNGVEDLPMTEALRPAASARPWNREGFSVSPFDYLARGRYVEYLERFSHHVARGRLRVVMFEELVAGPDVIAGLYEQLGVDPTFRPDGLGAAVNASVGDDEPIDPGLETELRDYFADADARLAAFLGRALPWRAGAT